MKQNKSVRFMTQIALLIAIEIVMKLIGLGSVPVGPLYMSFLTVPIAIGAICLGPVAGAILGGVFGLVSFKDAITGASAMTSIFFSISPIHTFILCVIMRVLMGACVGFIYQALKKAMKSNIRYFITSVCAPLLNTFFFMGYICLVFYQSEYIQNLVNIKGATNPIMFVILLVGVQGLIEAIVCAIVGGVASKTVDVIVNK